MATDESQPAELERLVNYFSREAFFGNAAWFVGAGASRPSKVAGWVELLGPLGADLGITVGDEDDLPAIAQYYINRMSGNRGPLIQHLKRVLDVSAAPSVYHHELARSNVSTIWTTNYDRLIEDALSLAGLSTRVRARDGDMAELGLFDGVEVIKAHGSFGVSEPHEFVIAKEDYEDFSQNKPATVERLRSDLLRKCFLFIGYGYSDPNIQSVLLEARRLAGRAGHSHIMLSVEEDPANTEKAQRQKLWQADLRRIGIECVLMPNFSDIESAVKQITLQSRGPTVYVTGGHETSSELAKEVGALFAASESERVIMLDGQSAGVSRDLLFEFQGKCVTNKIDINKRIRFFPNPYASNESFSNDSTLLPMLKDLRRPMLRKAHTVLVFDGGMGTEAEVEIAQELGCRIIPVPKKPEGLAARLLRSDKMLKNALDARSPGFVAKAEKFQLTAQDVIECVLAELPSWQ
jgi:predicted Rossmann-fold nucleotide-binding protein